MGDIGVGEVQEKGCSPGDCPKDARPLLFGSNPEPTRPGSCEEGHLKLLRAEVQIPGGENLSVVSMG